MIRRMNLPPRLAFLCLLTLSCARHGITVDDTAGSQLCDGVTCSDQGTCAVVQKDPQKEPYAKCICNTGYHPVDNTRCEQSSDPCQGVDCSNQGTCAVVADTPPYATCICNTGYHPVDNTRCERNSDPCQGVDCSNQGTCAVVDDTPPYAACVCNTGYHPVDNTRCERNGDLCQGVTCSNQGTCAVVPATTPYASCICNSGYRAVDNTTCSAEPDPCAGISCSGFGSCAVVNQTPTCFCDPHFFPQGTECLPEVVGDLSFPWQTPHSVELSWPPNDLNPGVIGYTVWYGEDQSDVLSRSGTALVSDANTDPNLAWGRSPYGPGFVGKTTLTELLPGTTYHVHLWANFLSSDSRPVFAGTVTTPQPQSQTALTIFDETLPTGWRMAFEDTLSTTAHSGSGALWYNGGGHWTNASLAEINLDLTPYMAADWNNAYLELYIKLEETVNIPLVPYLEVRLSPGTEVELYDYIYLALPTGPDWHRLQAPLSQFQNRQAEFLTKAQFGTSLNRFDMGFVMTTAEVYVDDIRIVFPVL